MNAAVVTDPARAPQWTTFQDPVTGEGEVLVNVNAAALSHLVRAQASRAHYSATASSSFVAGVDGVGRLDNGRRVYFAFPRSPFGAMAERVPVGSNLCIAVPNDVDDATAAAIANPGMSSWAALVERAKFVQGETVLINGATGAAGRLAIQIAKYLGANRVIATGRDEQQFEALRALGADETISLTRPSDELVAVLRTAIYDCGVAVILDYLWGVSAQQLLAVIAGGGSDAEAPRIRFVQIGAMSGPEIPFDASVLRSSRLELLGSGLRSVAHTRLVSIVGDVMRATTPAKLHIQTILRPFEAVETAWNEDSRRCRLVFTSAI